MVFDSKTCAAQLINCIKIPFVSLTLHIPSWTILHFKETDLDSRLLKVWWHEDSWTIEGTEHITEFWSYDIPKQDNYKIENLNISIPLLWSLGILQALPIVSKIYTGLIRTTLGTFLANTGKFLESASGGSTSHSYDVRPTNRVRHKPASGLFRTILIRWSDFMDRGKLHIPRPIHHSVDHYERQQFLLHLRMKDNSSLNYGFTCLPPRTISHY
jgi:hypothetical protein